MESHQPASGSVWNQVWEDMESHQSKRVGNPISLRGYRIPSERTERKTWEGGTESHQRYRDGIGVGGEGAYWSA